MDGKSNECRETTLLTKEATDGYKFNVRECVLKSGEIIDFPPEFEHVPCILENLDNLECREDDIWLVTYPKAGTHWTYEILDMLLRGEAKPAENYKVTAMLEFATRIEALNNLSSPRILNTHVRPKYLPQQLLKKNKIVHVARNPKSVAVSYYHLMRRLKHNEDEATFHAYLPTYLAGCHTLYGNWFEYMQEWLDICKGRDNVYLMFYEDMKKNPVKEIKGLATFLGLQNDESLIEDIADLSSFDKMKSGVGKNSEPRELKKFRKGTTNDWKYYFTVSENEEFDDIFNEKMKNYKDLTDKIGFE